MSDKLSASEAIKAVYTIDTVIWGQVRHLPLRLDKSYMNAFTALKKMQSNNEIIANSIQYNEDFLNHHVTAIGCNEKTVEVNPQIVKLKKIVKEKIAERKSDAENTLPDPVCVRSNHKWVSVFCEKRVAEMAEKKAFILPDGTSRQGVGDIAGVVVKVGDKICALQGLKISKGDRKNWATTIAHMLDRLATASNVEVDDIWQSITAMVSDLCKVNKQLASEIQSMIGSAWLPGQAFCNLHFSLAIPEGIKNILTTYQSHCFR